MDALKAGKGAVHLQSEDIQLNQSGACFALLDSALQVQPGNPDSRWTKVVQVVEGNPASYQNRYF
jgi:hypothetical protein